MGIVFCVGATGQRKTTMAQFLCAERAGERGVPVVILDPEGVLQYEGTDHFREIPPGPAFVASVWTNGNHAIYTPRDEEDADVFFDVVRSGGNVVLLVDECSHYAKGRDASKTLLHLCRAHRLVGVDLYFTTQAPKDLHPDIWNLRHEVYIFHQDGAGALDKLTDELDLTPDQVARIQCLEEGQYLKWTRKTNGKAKKKTEVPEGRRAAPPDPSLCLDDAPPAGGGRPGESGDRLPLRPGRDAARKMGE